ncbi:hypothetical protein GR255_26705, partial [Mycobacterium tuberculosis]|nr:hypothetical protein [Mycobacterium tuberculosis]
TGEVSCYRYSTFKRRVEILLSHSKTLNLNFDILEESTILNALEKVNSNDMKSVFEFLKADGKFNTDVWIDYLGEQGQVLLGNKTINDYIKEEVKKLTGEVSCYRYSTFKRRVEILLSHSKTLNLNFDIL